MSTNKEIYKLFCEREKSLPLFLTYDWLNTIFPENWDIVIEFKGDNIAGILPYILNRRKTFLFIELPAISAYGGPWLFYPEGQKYASSISYEKSVLTALIQKLPYFDSFVQKFYPSLKNWLPFYWQGFTQSTRYTYILRDLSDQEKLFNDFRENIRREIRKAEKTISIVPTYDVSVLNDLKQKAAKAKGIKIHTSLPILEKVIALCKKKNCGEVLIARQGDAIHCAGLFVWDKQTCYYLYGASAPELSTSGAMSLLLWEAIKRASSNVHEFNFEGSMIENVERFFRSFGAEQVPYSEIRKTNSKILKLRHLFKEALK